jgi:MoxR-like ATPases
MLTRSIDRIIETVGTVLLGKDDKIRLALACMLARGHLLIEDLPGMGKTTLAHALAAALGLQYKRVQFTSDLLPADILGTHIYDPESRQFKPAQGASLYPTAAGRRDQSQFAENAKCVARGHGGASGQHRRQNLGVARTLSS